jgi:hypothetical protein
VLDGRLSGKAEEERIYGNQWKRIEMKKLSVGGFHHAIITMTVSFRLC